MTLNLYRTLLSAFLLMLVTVAAHAGEVVFRGDDITIGKEVAVFDDSSSSMPLSDVINSAKFKPSREDAPNFGLSNSTFWIKLTLKNETNDENIFLELGYPRIEYCTLYTLSDGRFLPETISWNNPFNKRRVKFQNIVFNLKIPENEKRTFYLKIHGNEQIVMPLTLRNENGFLQFTFINEAISGIHIGVLFVMFLFNLFIYFSIRERSYLYYVFFILFIGLTQTTITGYTFKFLWPSHPSFNQYSIIIFPALGGIFAILFFQNFLHSKERAPTIHKVMNGVIVLYLSAVLCNNVGLDRISYRIIDVSAVTAALLALVVAIRLSVQGYRPAKFYLAAWSMFLLGIVLYTLRNFNILPYNTFTNYTMQAGTAIEVVLLSFALADKINILKREKEASQAQALMVSMQNEKMILEQNVFLDKSVSKRTAELQLANHDLKLAMTKLKDTQAQLIDSEKMASLGQLTAGIAHEINNPINFVSSNIMPLRRDIDDVLEILNSYDSFVEINTQEDLMEKIEEIEQLKNDLDLDYIKTELETLLMGMEDGANRTVEIVKGLKIFSRMDEGDLNLVNINEGIDSTLVILNYQMSACITLIKDLGNIPSIECYGGKLNQVFMNILSNAIYALKNEKSLSKQPTIWVKTSMVDPENISVSIRDNGPGMTPNVKAKIFEPFYTTKQVGDGTGLGLSIVFKIIEFHNGNIQVFTEVGKGTEFLITLPLKRKVMLPLHLS